MLKVVSISIVLLLYASDAFSWGAKGHIIVAEIAKSRLSKSIIDSVDYYLEGTSWEEAACWMDEMNQDRTYEFMKPWHYVNIPKDKTYVDTKTPNIINELDFIIAALQNRKIYTREKTGMYIKILMHLMGDLHQPLHCGYADDRGGNDLIVTFDGETSNLHKVWDSGLIKQKQIDEKDCFRLMKTWPAEEISTIKKASIMDCVNESRALLPKVYEVKNTVNGKYAMASVVIIKNQLSKAGLRLEAFLELCFSK
jgi:hypothetical protein